MKHPARAIALMAIAIAGCDNEYSVLTLASPDGGAGAASTSAGAQTGGAGGGGVGGSGAGASGGVGGNPSASSGGGGESSASGGTGVGGGRACARGTVGDLVDDFEDGALAPQWSGFGGLNGDVDETMGRVVLKPGPNPDALRGFSSTQMYAFDECSIFLEVVEPPPASDNTGVFFDLRQDSSHFIRFGIADGEMTYRIDDGAQGNIDGDPYDHGAHRWVRLRESDGMVHFDVSPDAAAWMDVATYPTPPFAASVEARVFVFTFDVTPTPDWVEVDRVNVAP